MINDFLKYIRIVPSKLNLYYQAELHLICYFKRIVVLGFEQKYWIFDIIITT